MPEGCHSQQDIQPGYFKYGWYADPQPFTTSSLPSTTTSAAATAAQKAMQGITIAPAKSAPLNVSRYSSSSGADASSQSWLASRRGSTTLSGPWTMSGLDDSSGSYASSMITETVDGSLASESSMMTTRTNKTRRGKRGGKKQRENSQVHRQSSLPPSPKLVSISCPTAPGLTCSLVWVCLFAEILLRLLLFNEDELHSQLIKPDPSHEVHIMLASCDCLLSWPKA